MSYNGANPAKYIEPPIKKGPSVNERWRYWYSSIADIMIRDPDITHVQIAQQLGKHPTTIGMIVGTDMFKEYFHQRREEFRKDHDFAIRARMTDVATESLDIVLDQLRTKKSQIPLNVALRVSESALDRLGYSPDTQPTVVVDNRQIDARQQTVNLSGLSAADLEDARAAMRLVEQAKSGTSLALGCAEPALEQGAGLDVSDVVDVSPQEVVGDPAP